MRRSWLTSYHVGYYKLKSNKLHANIQQHSCELIINILTHHLQYFFTFLTQIKKIKDNIICQSYPISQHDIKKSLVPTKLLYRSNLEIPRLNFARDAYPIAFGVSKGSIYVDVK